MEKWECTICGCIYDSEVGDVEHNIKVGRPFEALPKDWVCPICGATKDQFVKKT